MNSRYSTRVQERRAISPITRPAPLPSIPRPCTATPSAAAAIGRDDLAPTLTTRQDNARKGDGGGGRGVSPTPASTTKPAPDAEATAVLPVRKGDRKVGGNKRPEAIAWGDQSETRKGSDTPFPLAVVDGAGAASPGDSAKEATVKKAAAAISKPEPDVREGATPATTSKHTPERPGSLGVAGGPRHGRAAGAAGTSTSGLDRQAALKGSVSTTVATSAYGDSDGGVVAPPSPSLLEPNPGDPAGAFGVEKDVSTAAPAGSLVRLKRRKQQARIRSNSQR